MWSVPEAPLCGSKVETSVRSATRTMPPGLGWARAGPAPRQAAASNTDVARTPIRFMGEATLEGSAGSVKATERAATTLRHEQARPMARLRRSRRDDATAEPEKAHVV